MSEISFSFAGCGFLGIYHIGVASCLQRHVPHLLKKAKFFGASAGAMIACCMMCEVPMNECVDFILRLAKKSKSRTLGAFHPSVKINEILRSALEEVLPPNAHEICTDRLFVSVTHWWTYKNDLISKFPSRNHLIDALLMSAFVPVFSGILPPTYNGEYYIDGGLSDNLPVLDEHTILVSPFAGECDICPRDQCPQMVSLTLANTSMQCSMNNLARLGGALFPPHSIQLKDMCWQGFDDTLRYLSEHNLIRCPEHLLFSHLHHLERTREVMCKVCRRHIFHARKDRLPANIAAMLEDHMQSEQGLLHRLANLTPLRLVFWFSLPWTLAMESWFTSMVFFISMARNAGERLYNPHKISLQKIMELIHMGLDFVMGNKVYPGPWCNGDHPEAEEEPEEMRCEGGASRFCTICGRPQTYNARHGLFGKSKREKLEKLALAGAKDAASADDADLLHEPVAHKSDAPSVSLSGIATPASVRSKVAAAQQINFAFSVDFETHKEKGNADADAGQGDVSGQPQLELIHEKVEHLHMDNIALHPETAVVDEEADEPIVDISFPLEVMGDHVHMEEEGAAEAPDCLCPQALDTFQVCLDVFQDMEAIMTLHYLDEDNKMHAETIYGLPTHSIPHHSHPDPELSTQQSVEEEVEASSSAEGVVAAQGEENTWDSIVQHSTAVKQELMDIIEEKILQPERKAEERRRVARHRAREDDEGTISHFSLQVGGSLGAENLTGLMNSLNTSFSTCSMDLAGEAAGNPHLLKSVSDASTLAKRLQALKEESQARSEAGSLGTCMAEEEASKDGQRSLGNHRLGKSLHEGDECAEQSTGFRRFSSLVKARSDGSGLTTNLHMMKEQDKSLEHAVSAQDLNVDCGAAAGKPPAERNFVSEVGIDVDLEPRTRRRMRGKFHDERLSRSQRSLDGSASRPHGGAGPFQDSSHRYAPSSSESDSSLSTSSLTSEAQTHRTPSTASNVHQAEQETYRDVRPSYAEFSRSTDTQAKTNLDEESTHEGDVGSAPSFQPRLVRSHSLQKCQDALKALRSDLETLKQEDEGKGETPFAQPQEGGFGQILFSSLVDLDEDSQEKGQSDQLKDEAAQKERKKSSSRHCKPS